jgi:hypothetical protein
LVSFWYNFFVFIKEQFTYSLFIYLLHSVLWLIAGGPKHVFCSEGTVSAMGCKTLARAMAKMSHGAEIDKEHWCSIAPQALTE